MIPTNEQIELLAANWVNGNRNTVIEFLTTRPVAQACYFTLHLVQELQAAGGDALGDLATLSTMLETATWKEAGR